MQKINWPLVVAVIVVSAILVFMLNVKVAVAHDMDHPEEDASVPIVYCFVLGSSGI